MTYAEPYVYLRLLGTIGTTTKLEEWGCGIKLRNPGTAPSSTDMTTFLEDIATPCQTFHSAPDTRVGTGVQLTELTAAYVGIDGKYVGGGTQATTRHAYGSPVNGNGTVIHPYSTALVISLRTSLTRGRASNGRIYYPMTVAPIVPTTGVLDPTLLGLFCDNAKTWLDAINTSAAAHLPGTGGISVMSNVGTGVAATVTDIRVGARIDAMESRERDIPEGYVYRPLAAGFRLKEERAKQTVGQELQDWITSHA